MFVVHIVNLVCQYVIECKYCVINADTCSFLHFFFYALISILSVTQCKKEADMGWLVILEKDTCICSKS